MDLSIVIGPALALLTHRATGSMTPVFLLAAVPAFAGLVVTLLWRRKAD